MKKTKRKTVAHSRRNGTKPAAKTTNKSTDLIPIPQPHGGALNPGGTPGNAGGTGRPPSAIRAAMRKHLDTEVLADVLAKRKTGALDTLDVAEFLAKYGLGTMKEVSVENVRERLRLTLEVLRRELSAPQLRIIIPQIEGVWKG